MLALVRGRVGIAHDPDRNLRDVEGFVRRRCAALGFRDADAYLTLLERASDADPEFQRMVDLMSNTHTSFFRHRRTFEVIGELLDQCAHRPVRIWSACCATGEEAWTVALLAAQQGVDVEILGTDIHHQSVAAARLGEFAMSAMAKVPAAMREAWFEGRGGRYRVRSELRRGIRFELHNVLTPGPRDFDIVLCQNALIYFRPEQFVAAAENLVRALRADGTLIVGPAESLFGLDLAVQPLTVGGDRIVWRHQERALLEPPNTVALPTLAPVPAPPSPTATNGTESSPDGAEVERWLQRGHAALREHRFDEAAQAYRDVVEVEPLRVDAHLATALMHRKSGELDAALRSLRRVEFLDSENWLGLYLMAGVCDRLGRPEASLKAARAALALVRRDAPLHVDPMLAELLPTQDQVMADCVRRIS